MEDSAAKPLLNQAEPVSDYKAVTAEIFVLMHMFRIQDVCLYLCIQDV